MHRENLIILKYRKSIFYTEKNELTKQLVDVKISISIEKGLKKLTKQITRQNIDIADYLQCHFSKSIGVDFHFLVLLYFCLSY